MSDPYLQLYSQNWFAGDGATTIWNFTFENGYIDKAFVKAYTLDGQTRADLTITGGMWTGPYQLTITPAVPAGLTLVIYRDTPKTAPLVNYSTGARFTEGNLDESNNQTIDLIQEILDHTGALDLDQLGYKAMKHLPYTGASVVQLADNGRSHYKTDGTSVTVPNTLPVEFLSTIINNNASPMSIGFDAGLAILQGAGDTAGVSTLTLDGKNTLSITKIEDGVWFVSGAAS